jgi:hypothetical protein
MTTAGLSTPTHRAPRGGMMNGSDFISLAELTQYALIMVSSGSHEVEGWPRRTRIDSVEAPDSPLGP